MDPHEPDVNERAFSRYADWKDFYGDAVEEDTPNMMEPLGKTVIITAFVGADHASNVVTRRSNTGTLLFMNNALIISFRKRQNSVK